MNRQVIKTRLKSLEAKAKYRDQVMSQDRTIIKMTYSAIDSIFIVYRCHSVPRL